MTSPAIDIVQSIRVWGWVYARELCYLFGPSSLNRSPYGVRRVHCHGHKLMETHPNGELNLLLNRLIEGEAVDEEIAEIEELLCNEPTAMDAYFDLIEIHALLQRRLGIPATSDQASSAIVKVGAADLPAETVLANNVPAIDLPSRSIERVPAIESAPSGLITCSRISELRTKHSFS